MESEQLQKQYESETGKKWWTNPVAHGEIAFASWEYQKWLEQKVNPVEAGVILQKGDLNENDKKLLDYILEKEKEGKVCIMTIEGLMECNLDDIIKQPAEGLLYDLNRDRVTTLTWIGNDSPKWINDFAVCLVITKLKALLSK